MRPRRLDAVDVTVGESTRRAREPRRFRDAVDAGLLNDVCNHILEIADLKLACFKGNLAAFVKVRPEARAYFELKSNKLKFHFPKPGPIEGRRVSVIFELQHDENAVSTTARRRDAVEVAVRASRGGFATRSRRRREIQGQGPH